jgi:DNA repair protein RadC
MNNAALLARNFYSTKNTSLVLNHGSKPYVLKIHDMPAEDRPREKLIKYGPTVLNLAELLAVVFNTGSKKEDVLTMTKRLLKEYGHKSLVSQKNVKQLEKQLGIPENKACQLVACLELGKRLFISPNQPFKFLRSPEQVFEYVKDIRHLTKEHLRGIYLNNHYHLIHDEVISIGTLDTNIVHPREVFKPAIEHSASALILVHNHPSGVAKASEADIKVTKQLIEAGKLLGITLLDHVIVTKNKFTSVPVDYN